MRQFRIIAVLLGLLWAAPAMSEVNQGSQDTGRVVPEGCPIDSPIDSCAPLIKPFDCAVGRHWSNAGGIGVAHCVDDDYTCPTNTTLTHDSLGNPSCIPVQQTAATATATQEGSQLNQGRSVPRQTFSSGWTFAGDSGEPNNVTFTVTGVTEAQMNNLNARIKSHLDACLADPILKPYCEITLAPAQFAMESDAMGLSCSFPRYTYWWLGIGYDGAIFIRNAQVPPEYAYSNSAVFFPPNAGIDNTTIAGGDGSAESFDAVCY